MTPTAFRAVVSGDADAGVANNDMIPTAITVMMAASATITRPAAGRASGPVVCLAGVVLTVDQSSRSAATVTRLWEGGWQLKKKHPLVRFDSHTGRGGDHQACRVLAADRAVQDLLEGNPRTACQGRRRGGRTTERSEGVSNTGG